MQRSLLGRQLSVVSLSLALLAVGAPARAASLPKSKPTETQRCANGKTAKAWLTFGGLYQRVTRLAVDNPCKGQWFQVLFRCLSESDPCGEYVFVAPGQSINWDAAKVMEWNIGWGEDEYDRTDLVTTKTPPCVQNFESADGWSGFGGLLVFDDKDVRNAPECGQPVPKLPADRSATASCPGTTPAQGDDAQIIWKTDGKKLIKLYAQNYVCNNWLIAWWQLDNGKKVAVWLEPGSATDLWKAELAPVPTKMKDGRVHIGFDRTLGVDADDQGSHNPKKNPFAYNFNANGDKVY